MQTKNLSNERAGRGQGATEYLVVLGAVLMVSVMVVAVTGSAPTSSQDVIAAQSKSYWMNSSSATLAQGVDVTVAYGQAVSKTYWGDGVLFGSTTDASIDPAARTVGYVVACENYDCGAYPGVSSFGPIFVRKYVSSEPVATFGAEQAGQ